MQTPWWLESYWWRMLAMSNEHVTYQNKNLTPCWKEFNLAWEWEAEVLHLCIYYLFVKQKRKLPQNQCTLDWRSVSEITNPQSVYIEGVTCHIKDIQSTLVKCVRRHWKFMIYDQARRFDILWNSKSEWCCQ